MSRAPLRQSQRLSAYGLATDGDAVLMVQIGRGAGGDDGTWTLPGGGVEHGEPPAETVVREFADCTGLQVAVERLLDLGSDHRQLPNGVDFHGLYAVYAVAVTGGALTTDPELPQPTWVKATEFDGLPMLDEMRRLLTTHR